MVEAEAVGSHFESLWHWGWDGILKDLLGNNG